MSGEPEEPEADLIAYLLNPEMAMPLVPAGQERDWMRALPNRFAHRCLPLLMANQSGWLLLSAHTLQATWTGEASEESLMVEYLSGSPPYPAISHFGWGILTWTPPYLFRTPPGWNLLVRGPANYLKDGIQALEGLVETDWSAATFTVNWKMTRPQQTVTFEVGEPIAMLVPQKRHDLETFRPVIESLADNDALYAELETWTERRAKFLFESQIFGTDSFQQQWQKDYFRGEKADGTRATQHQTRRVLRPFGERGEGQ